MVPEKQSTIIPAESQAGDWLKVGIGILVSLVCLVIIFLWIDLDQLVEALRLADYRWVLVSSFVTLGWLLVRSLAWRALLKNRPAYLHVFLSMNQGYLLNNLLPFRMGEIGRAFLLGRKSGLGFWQVFPSIVVERLIDLILAAALFLSTLPFALGAGAEMGSAWALQAGLITGVIMLAGLGTLYLAARNRSRVQSLSDWLGRRIPLLGRPIGRFLPAFLDGLSVLTEARQFLAAVGWLLLNWILGLIQYYLLLLAFFPQAQVLWGAFTLGAAALGLAAPSSPGGIGVYEFAVMSALALFIDAPAQTAAFAFIAHLLPVSLTGLIGAYALIRDGESLAGLYRKARSLKGKGEGA